jgi:protease-4
MTYDPPPGQGPIDPRGAFQPPPPPGNFPPPPRPPMPPGAMMPPFPPPMFMPPPPPRPRGGFVRGVFVTLATTIFGLSLTLNIYLLIVSGILTGGGSHSTNLVDGDPKQKIAVVPISGIIMDELSTKFDRWMRAIDKDDDVKALVIEIDSPGGSVTSSDEIWHRIRKYKADHANVPIVIAMNGLAASGGYYVACAGDYLFAQPSTLTGNIGVLLPNFNLSRLMDKWGIEEKTIVSQGADFKNAGSMFQPERAEDRAYLQDIADKCFTQFKDIVAKGRQSKLTKPLAEIANGKIYMAADALALGLIDQIGYPHDAYAYAAKKANLKNMMVVKYRDPPTIFDALSGSSNVGSAQAHSVTINGVNINGGDLHELLTPRLMYLWRGQ